MDSYPDELAPNFDEGGGVITPFDEWWARVSKSYPTVPKDVAEQWLHRHWGHSHFGFLVSDDYVFELVNFDPEEILNIWNFSNKDVQEAKKTGAYRLTQNFWVRNYMVETLKFPRPIIVLDNLDNHIEEIIDRPHWLKGHQKILVEGHRRHEVAVGMFLKGMLSEPLEMWLMKKI